MNPYAIHVDDQVLKDLRRPGVNFRPQRFADRTHFATDFNDEARGCIRNRKKARGSWPGMDTSCR